MQNVLLAFALNQEGKELQGVSANQGSMVISNIYCMLFFNYPLLLMCLKIMFPMQLICKTSKEVDNYMGTEYYDNDDLQQLFG